ncbi:MAG: hypothetical protein ABI972_17100 [Acidobacteriota bacterium]
MRIESSAVDYSVYHSYSESHQVSDEVRVQIQKARERTEPVRGRAELVRDRAELSNEAATVPADGGVEEGDDSSDARATLAKLVIRVLLKGKFDHGGQGIRTRSGAGQRPEGRAAKRAQGGDGGQAQGPRWNVQVRHREVYEEKESLVVGAKGAIKTADGREFQFDAAFSLQRSFRVESGSAIEFGNGGKASDPLFLDRGGVSQLLVRDANGDGKLTDLSEVFGPSTGDGFSELAAFDADHNGWIDEGDPVFGELRLRLEDGTLTDLGALGIGALSTSGIAGEFQYKNDANELVATVRKTGVYLNENGTAGALRQIDLVV